MDEKKPDFKPGFFSSGGPDPSRQAYHATLTARSGQARSDLAHAHHASPQVMQAD
jgi:hypothetical protein